MDGFIHPINIYKVSFNAVLETPNVDIKCLVSSSLRKVTLVGTQYIHPCVITAKTATDT